MEKREKSKLLLEIPKNSLEIIRITQDEYRGHTCINLRVWYLERNYSEETQAYKPSKKGISLQLEAALKLFEALPDVVKELKAGVSC